VRENVLSSLAKTLRGLTSGPIRERGRLRRARTAVVFSGFEITHVSRTCLASSRRVRGGSQLGRIQSVALFDEGGDLIPVEMRSDADAKASPHFGMCPPGAKDRAQRAPSHDARLPVAGTTISGLCCVDRLK